MTEDQLIHPLTEEKALSLFSFERLMDTGRPITIADAMRTAADWQLEQVIKWLDENIAHYHYRHYYDTGEYPRPIRRWDKLTEHLKEAMRPKEDS